jgi:hypothetical protein
MGRAFVRDGRVQSSGAGGGARALFFIEYGLGHKTHVRFLQEHLARDPRFDPTIFKLYWLDPLGDLLARLSIPPLRERGLDFWTWWVFQFKRQQVRYLLRRYDPASLDLVYIHTQTAATSILDLPRNVPTVVSIDLTWRLAFQESRYIASPFFKPTLDLERRIYERANLVVSFSDWAANSVIEDYGIPASKVKVVRNGVTLPPAPAAVAAAAAVDVAQRRSPVGCAVGRIDDPGVAEFRPLRLSDPVGLFALCRHRSDVGGGAGDRDAGRGDSRDDS